MATPRATQHKETSFNAFLSSTPTIKELTEHVNVGTNWYLVGTMLELDQKRLKSIEAHTGHTDAHKTIEMFNLWLDTTPRASRRQILEALRADAVEEITLAHKYEKHLRELHKTTFVPPSTEAVFILQRNVQSLNEALVSPVQVSQLLYCKRCISEATLDEMERIDQRRSLDDKKTTLLTAMQETVSSDYRKLKDIATVLSGGEQTRDIANEIMTEYEEKIPQEEDGRVVQPQEVVGSNANCASDILRNNYSALSQSIIQPVRMARLLNEEVISDEALSCVMSTRGFDSRAVLLKAVRDAVHSNYKHLELFVTVLRKFSETAHIGDTIFEEYRKHFNYDDDVSENEVFLAEKNRDLQQKSMSTSSESSSLDDNKMDNHGNHKILFPRNMRKEFEELRSKFGSTFFRVRRIFKSKKNVLDIDEVKELICDCFPDLKPQLSDKTTIGAVLDVLKRKCNIVNLRPLEDLASEFNIKEAESVIESFKEEAKKFCRSVSGSLSLGEKLQAVATPSRLLCETVVFVFNWDPDKCTLQDINDVLFELEPLNRFKYHLQVDEIDRGESVVVTCYCPAEYISSLIITILGKIDTLQWKGLKKFMLGNCTVWNATQVVSPNTDEAELPAQINYLKAALKVSNKKIMATETELAIIKEQSENRLEELKALQMDLEKSQCINVEKEEVINQLKDAMSLLEEKLLEKEIPRVQKDGQVAWGQIDVQLTSPSLDQCMEIISELEEEHESITLKDSSSDSTQFLISAILKKGTVTAFTIYSSFLSRNDIHSFSSQLSKNESLTTLVLTTGSIDDNGVVLLAESLQDNKTLKFLYLNDNPDITSASADSLAELLRNNDTIIYLNLYGTTIDTIGVVMLMESLKTNKTLEDLVIDKEHEEVCSTLPYYEDIENKIFYYEDY